MCTLYLGKTEKLYQWYCISSKLFHPLIKISFGKRSLKFKILGNYVVIDLGKLMANKGVCCRHMYFVLQSPIFHLINCIFFPKVHFGRRNETGKIIFFLQRNLNSHFSTINANTCPPWSSLLFSRLFNFINYVIGQWHGWEGDKLSLFF